MIKVWWTEKIASSQSGEPGEVLALLKDGILVKSGNDTAIKITELQPAGKKRMSAEQMLRGAHDFAPGMKLGE